MYFTTAVPGHVMGEGPRILVPAPHILHNHAEMLPPLEAAVHRDDKGNVSLLWILFTLNRKRLQQKYRIFVYAMHSQMILYIPDKL